RRHRQEHRPAAQGRHPAEGNQDHRGEVMGADLVLLSEQEGIAVVTINRPDKLNALNEEVIARLTTTFESCRDSASIRAVVLTGSGEKAFVAGADIAVLATLDSRSAKETAQRGQRLTLL